MDNATPRPAAPAARRPFSLLLLIAIGGLHAAHSARAAPAAAKPPASQPASQPEKPAAPAPAAAGAKAFPVPPPPFSEGIFPCTECHSTSEEPNTTRRVLADEHTKIKLHHGTRERWCFDCHNPKDRDQLRLASGALVPFTESYRLCGQCHGPKLRDWRLGAHGKRTGYWNGKKRYLLCAHCHDPHAPRFAPIKPLPPPRRPRAHR